MSITGKDVMDAHEIANRITAIRKVIGLGQKEFASSIGVNHTALNNWEKGKGNGMPAHGAARIYKKYLIEPNYFYINDLESVPKIWRQQVLELLAAS